MRVLSARGAVPPTSTLPSSARSRAIPRRPSRRPTPAQLSELDHLRLEEIGDAHLRFRVRGAGQAFLHDRCGRWEGGSRANVNADASRSTAPEGRRIATYTFDFGDGSRVVGPLRFPLAVHLHWRRGTFTVTVTVTDGAGFSSQAQKTATVR
jgi:PKD domain